MTGMSGMSGMSGMTMSGSTSTDASTAELHEYEPFRPGRHEQSSHEDGGTGDHDEHERCRRQCRSGTHLGEGNWHYTGPALPAAEAQLLLADGGNSANQMHLARSGCANERPSPIRSRHRNTFKQRRKPWLR